MMNAMSEIISQFHFLRPGWLWLLLPVTLVLWTLIKSKNERVKWTDAIAPHLRASMISNAVDRGGRSKVLWLGGALLLGILSVSGPTWVRTDSPSRQNASDIIIAIDLSASMNVSDIKPSRLERAKLKMRDFVEANQTNRIGLIAFAGSAHSVVQPTRNSAAILLNLERLRTSIMPVAGSDLASALLLSDSLLHSSDSSASAAGNIILVTDSPDPQSLATSQLIADSTGHEQIIWLFSSVDGGPIPTGRTGSFVKTIEGATAISALKTEVAKTYDSIPRVHIVQSTPDEKDVTRIQSEIAKKTAAQNRQTGQSEEWQDMGEWFLFPIAVIVLFWFRKGWVLQWAWIVMISIPLAGCSPDRTLTNAFWTADQQGQFLLNQGDTLQGAGIFKNAIQSGSAYLAAGDLESSVERFTASLSPVGMYNAGIVHVQMAQEYRDPEWREKVAAYRLAISSFDEAIRLDSLAENGTSARSVVRHENLASNAAHNRDIVYGEVERLLARFTGGGPTELTRNGQADGSIDKPDSEDNETEELDQGGAAPPEGGAPTPSNEPGELNPASETYSADELRASVVRSLNADPAIYLKRKFLLQLRNSSAPPTRRMDPW